MSEQKCPVCETLLRELCLTEGTQFCDLRDRYYSDPGYSSDRVLYDVVRMAKPGQIRQIRERLLAKENNNRTTK